MAIVEHIMAYSDLVDIATEQVETVVIEYKNQNVFADIDYSIIPKPTFKLRIWAKFFKARDPEEMESEELSDRSVVMLMSDIKAQRLLQIEESPFYLLRKIKLALKHNSILIDQLYWTREENIPYEELDERYPFNIAQVYLTKEDNQYLTNTYGIA